MPVVRAKHSSSLTRAKPVIASGNLGISEFTYPLTQTDRDAFRTNSGKKVTDHQWAVYDHILQVPEGKVTTYKRVCLAIGAGSPRSVGSALRNNPFAPYVPCHRVVASNFFIGGFYGEWGTISKTGIVRAKSPTSGGGLQGERKLEILRNEGVFFDSQGYLRDRIGSLWKQ